MLKRQHYLWIIILVYCILAIHFFNTFPNGWDQTEYSWMVRDNYLPHSPYIFYFIVGSALSIFLPAPIALSFLSFVSGLGIIVLVWKIAEKESNKLVFIPSLLLATTFIFVIQSSTQEIYIFFSFMVVLTLYFLFVKKSIMLSAIAFGLTFATHNATVFLLPALLYYIYKKKHLLKWSLTAFIPSPTAHFDANLPRFLSSL